MTRGIYGTAWSLETSEETSYSVFASILMGKLYLVNQDTDERLTIAYRAVVVGQGKGAPVGVNWSKKSDPSGDIDNVVGFQGRRTFGWAAFPCYGYILGMGASLGVVGSVGGLDVTGGGLSIAFFGAVPFAAIRLWGLGRGALPGIGIGGGPASFSLVDS